MPTYEYLCTECNTNHDIVQSMADPTLTTCPDCGKETLRKQFTGVGVMFKGSGFYRTDSRAAESSTPANTSKSDSATVSPATTSAPSTSSSPTAKPAAEKSAPKKSESSSGSASKS